ncbi:MAG TPA: ABC transporter ATP-binding protein, partial [Phycicoccus sp.]|nr:ABC transporter ATP-binding protein [Phycicoccus sp.]
MRARFVVVAAGSVVLAGLELLGLAVLLLLIQQLTQIGPASAPVRWLREATGYPSPQTLLVLLGVAVLVVYTAKTAFAVFFRRWVLHFTAQQEVETAHRLLIGYLRGPYSKVQRRSPADLVARLFDYTSSLYGNVVVTLVGIASEALTITVVLGFIVLQMPVPAVVAVVFFSGAFFVVNWFVKPRSRRAGATLADTGARAFRATLQSLGGLKEIRVRQTQDHFIDEYLEARGSWASAKAESTFLGELPRYVLEMLFIIGVILVVGVVSLTSDPGQTLPLIALFIAAGFRLLPSVNRLLAASASIRVGLPQMELVVADLLEDLQVSEAYLSERAGSPSRRTLPLTKALVLEEVSFRYPDSDHDVLDGVSLSIDAGRSVALVGASGAGKTTLVDIILGLHEPRRGRVVVDGTPVSQDLAAWQRTIGLVPQEVFVLDATLRENIALGLDASDDARLADAIGRAQLTDLVDELQAGADTMLGDRGSRLSGGQRQRVGIARALYANPTLLVLDEATSALDNETERRITETIRS